MNARLLKNLRNAAAYFILISIFAATPAPAALADHLFLFRSPDGNTPSSVDLPRTIQQNLLLKLDEKGDLLIQCGRTRFTVAYNAPADLLKPSEQQYNPQRESSSTINGISLTASLSF